MDLKKFMVLSGFAIFMLATAQIALAEEAAVALENSVAATSYQQATLPQEIDLQWAWGEVTNIDSQNGTVTLKYLDYETDQEKELVLVVDEKTTFENMKDFYDLKLKDTLSIDYMIAEDSRNIAKNISAEKPEVASSTSAAVENSQLVNPPPITGQTVVEPAGSALPAQTVTPDLAQPSVQPETPVDLSITTNEAPASVEPAPAAQGQTQ